MQAARMSFEGEVIKLRAENKNLRIRDHRHERTINIPSSKLKCQDRDYTDLKIRFNTLEQNYGQASMKIDDQAKLIESLNLIVE